VEVYLTKSEIRRRVNALLGFNTNAAQYDRHKEMVDELINEGSMSVHADMETGPSETTTTGTVGIDQEVINFPSGTTAGNIIEVGIWDSDEARYVPLEAEDADTYESRRDRPEICTLEGSQVRIWPRPDQEYPYAIRHTVTDQLIEDDAVSTVDAMLIIRWAAAGAQAALGRDDEAKASWAIYADRLTKLKSKNNKNHTWSRSRGHRLRANASRIRVNLDIPNSGVWPSQVP
jgi:hypothetical protein